MTVRSLFASAALLAASCATAQGPPVTTASELRSAIAAAGPARPGSSGQNEILLVANRV